MKRIRKFLQLAWQDQLLLIQSILVLRVVALGLSVLPWLTLQRLLLKLANWYSRFVPTKRPSTRQITWAIRVASWYVPKATCLPQALTAQLLLIQRAYPADLQIGVTRSEDGKLEAHAWVTSENGIIIGGVHAPDRFVPLSPMEKQGIEDYGRAL
jgi:hypothetical protein